MQNPCPNYGFDCDELYNGDSPENGCVTKCAVQVHRYSYNVYMHLCAGFVISLKSVSEGLVPISYAPMTGEKLRKISQLRGKSINASPNYLIMNVSAISLSHSTVNLMLPLYSLLIVK